MTISPAAALVQGFTEQAPVTAWPQRLLLTVLVVALIGLAVWAMARNWRRRIARQSWVETTPVPEGFTATASFPARYVASVRTEDWLDRIAAQGLGMPGNASVEIGDDGVLVRREGANDLFLPSDALLEATVARGMAQEVYEADGLLAITWSAGGGRVTTGLRLVDPQEQLTALGAVQRMIGEAAR